MQRWGARGREMAWYSMLQRHARAACVLDKNTTKIHIYFGANPQVFLGKFPSLD